MKNGFYALLMLTGLVSCQKEPSACFKANKTSVEVNEAIKFTDCSSEAISYEWDFGDGNSSTQTSPSHTYNSLGTYTVELKTFSKNGNKTDRATKTISVLKECEINLTGDLFFENTTDFSIYVWIDEVLTYTLLPNESVTYPILNAGYFIRAETTDGSNSWATNYYSIVLCETSNIKFEIAEKTPEEKIVNKWKVTKYQASTINNVLNYSVFSNLACIDGSVIYHTETYTNNINYTFTSSSSEIVNYYSYKEVDFNNSYDYCYEAYSYDYGTDVENASWSFSSDYKKITFIGSDNSIQIFDIEELTETTMKWSGNIDGEMVIIEFELY